MTDVDTANGSLLNLLANLNVSIGQVAQSNKKLAEEFVKSRIYEQPVWMDISGTVLMGSSGVGIIRFNNSPDQGHEWYVRRLYVGGVTRATVAAGSCDVYRGNALENSQFAAGVGTMGTVGWEDFSAALPNRAQYARGELTISWPDDLYIVITGGTNGQEYVAQARIQDHQQAAYKGTQEY